MALNPPTVELLPYTEQDPNDIAEFVHNLTLHSGRDMELQGLSQLNARNETLASARASAIRAAGSMAVNKSHTYVIEINGRPRGVATAVPGIIPLEPIYGLEVAGRFLPNRVLRAAHLMRPVFVHEALVNVAYFVPLIDPVAADLKTLSSIVEKVTDRARTFHEGRASAWALVVPDDTNRRPGGIWGDQASKQEAYAAAGYSLRSIGYFDEREGIRDRLPRMAMMTTSV